MKTWELIHSLSVEVDDLEDDSELLHGFQGPLHLQSSLQENFQVRVV